MKDIAVVPPLSFLLSEYLTEYKTGAGEQTIKFENARIDKLGGEGLGGHEGSKILEG